MFWIVVGIIVLIAVTAWWLSRRGSTGMDVHGSTDTEASPLGHQVGGLGQGRGGSAS